MKFEWDKKKNEINLQKHGISFEEATLIFSGPVFTAEDKRHSRGEIRRISIGEVEKIIVVVVVHTKRGESTRIISARKANKKERSLYYEDLKKEN